MTSSSATLRVTTDLPWLVRGWCRLLVIPCLRVDDMAHEIAWGSPRASTSIPVDPGKYRVQFKTRFRGTRDLGASSLPLVVRLGAGDTLQLFVQIPFVNGHPPTLSVWAADGSADN